MQAYLAERQARVDHKLADFLTHLDCASSLLLKAMQYAVLNGGKRLRPLLVYAAGEALGAHVEQLDAAALAIEFVHTYSLIHDDLPAMDNDDFRRGQPTCHKVYGEAMAILAGDALQALAFEVLAKNHADLVAVLAGACGVQGMVGGQALEFSPDELPLEKIRELKTAALIRASVQLGAMIGNASKMQLAQLDTYARYLGLAYQIQDDIQDKQNHANEAELTTAKKNAIRALEQLFNDKITLLHQLTDHIIVGAPLVGAQGQTQGLPLR